MKDEVRRILKLVQEGKLSADDAAELIEAFEGTASEPEGTGSKPDEGAHPPPPPPKAEDGETIKDPLRSLVEAIEKLGKEAAKGVNWQEVAKQAKESASKAGETIKAGFESVRKGGGFSFLTGGFESREVILPLSFAAGKTLRIDNPCGDIFVSGGKEKGQVTASAKFRGIGEDVKKQAESYTLIIEESETAVSIRQPDVPGLSVDLDITLPGSCAVEIRSQSGDVEVSATKSNCRIFGKSGDCRVKDVDGQIEISGMSGDISIEDSVATSCSIENKSGDIVLRRLAGNVNMRTTSGDVELNDCDLKSLAIDGVSGDIHVDMRSPITHAVSVRTVSGNVDVAVPDGSDCRVALKALRGHVSCAIPLQEEARGEGQVTGKLGEGKGTFDVSAVSGDIKVEMHVSF